MYKPIARVGNSFALILDKTICGLLGLELGTVVKITTDGEKLLIEPTDRAKEPKDLRRGGKA